MKSWRGHLARHLFAYLLAVAAAGWNIAHAQAEGAAPAFKPEEIEALVAPIALYPDSLLSQVLMASTYPLEIVQAARWVKANPNVKGEAAVKAVENETWDVSVKSLVAFPQALEPMNEKLDWTQKLGDAFLADQKSVLDAVQRLRTRAEQAGNLQSTEQQKVIVEQAAPQQTVIKIEPANPQVIYVPAYNPTIVYGAWMYPGFPPYYWPPPPLYYPGGALVRGFAWGVGVAAAGAMFGGCNWGRGDVNINVNRATNIDRNFNRTNVGGGGQWQHDASHRKGVSYRDSASREKYGKGVGGAEGRNDFRGREGGAGNRAGTGDRGGQGDRGGPSVADRGGPGTGDRSRPSTADRGGPGAGGNASRDNAFQGVGGGSASQRDFDRGRASNQSMATNRGGAGASAGARPSGGGAGARPSGGGAARGGGGGGRRR
jgi:Protein of unknown function (DUF3300)